MTPCYDWGYFSELAGHGVALMRLADDGCPHDAEIEFDLPPLEMPEGFLWQKYAYDTLYQNRL